jgi:glycosyltransferase involved in cell wall biosynthesis
MKVSVIVPHYNDLAALDLCLAALERQTFPPHQREIIVADNASPQGEAAVANVIANRARLVTVAKKGAGPARNGGVAAARGDILAFTDSDCLPEPQWLEKGVAALADCDFAGGGVEVTVRDASEVSPAESFERVFAFDIERYVTRKSFAATCNLFCPRAVFDAVGPFGVEVSEDIDWSHRAVGQGFRIGYAPAAIVGHPARRTWDELRRKWIRLNAEKYALMAQKRGGRLQWALQSLALPAASLIHSIKVVRSHKLQGGRQRLGALWVLYRLRFWQIQHSFRLLAAARDR